MKPELQRIKIAEACGFTSIRMVMGDPMGMINGKLHFVPNYLNSLDAIHEAENLLIHNNPDLRESYRRTLIEVCGEKPDGFTRYWMAEASQRAEAFLRTLNLWQE